MKAEIDLHQYAYKVSLRPIVCFSYFYINIVTGKPQYVNIFLFVTIDMQSITPAVNRYLLSCRNNNIQGVRAYLTTIHCNPHWAYRGLQYCVEGGAQQGLRLICEYKKKVNGDHDAEWSRLSTDALRRLFSKNVDNASSGEILSLLLEANPKPDLTVIARSIGESKSLSALEIALPFLSTEQKHIVFERACKTRGNADCVERMLCEINVESMWSRIADSWDKPCPESVVAVENHLLHKTLLREIETTEDVSVSRRKM